MLRRVLNLLTVLSLMLFLAVARFPTDQSASFLWKPAVAGTVAGLVALAGTLAAADQLRVRRNLRRYWDRRDVRGLWRSAFPGHRDGQVATFLAMFCDAFDFTPNRRMAFEPHDRVVDVYRTKYPRAGMTDGFEFERFADAMRRNYSFDLPHGDMTLGDIFGQVHATAR